MKATLLIPALAILITGCATQSNRYAEPPTVEEQFAMLDQDADGRISRDQYGELFINEMANYMDKDRDGVITKEEFMAIGGSAIVFNQIDKSRTGRLTVEDFKSSPLARRLITAAALGADTSRDGTISLAEAQAYQKSVREYFR